MSCVHCIPCSLERIEETLKRMEKGMANEAELLGQIKAKLADVTADVRAKLEQVRGEVSPEGQQAFDEVLNSLSNLDAEIGDADGSDGAPTPAPGQDASGAPASDQAADPNAGGAAGTDENGTPVDADGNPLPGTQQ